MLVTIDWIAKNYSKFNKLCFNGELPNITFKINRSRTNWGLASFLFDYDNDTVIPECITISNYYDSPEEVKIQTLLHEMIHISDYIHCPFHFIRNRRRVSARYYDAHGKWFMMEAKRVSNITGYKVTNHVTDEEFNNSKLSNKSKRIEEYRNKNALICAVVGNNSIFINLSKSIGTISAPVSFKILLTISSFSQESIEQVEYTISFPGFNIFNAFSNNCS